MYIVSEKPEREAKFSMKTKNALPGCYCRIQSLQRLQSYEPKHDILGENSQLLLILDLPWLLPLMDPTLFSATQTEKNEDTIKSWDIYCNSE